MTGTSIREPLQARSKESTRRLLDAALVVLERDGVQGLTVAAVSRESGVSNGSLYHRFGGRDQLIAACEERFFERLVELGTVGDPRMYDETDPYALLDYVIEGFEDFYGQQHRIFRAFTVARINDDRVSESSLRFDRMAADLVVGLLVDRIGCSKEAADAAYRILIGRALLDLYLPDQDLPGREFPLETDREYVRRAVAAILGLPPRG